MPAAPGGYQCRQRRPSPSGDMQRNCTEGPQNCPAEQGRCALMESCLQVLMPEQSPAALAQVFPRKPRGRKAKSHGFPGCGDADLEPSVHRSCPAQLLKSAAHGAVTWASRAAASRAFPATAPLTLRTRHSFVMAAAVPTVECCVVSLASSHEVPGPPCPAGTVTNIYGHCQMSPGRQHRLQLRTTMQHCELRQVASLL